MHWSIPSQVEDVNEGGTFYFNACFSDGKHTETLKKVTCKTCKHRIALPTTTAEAAALIYTRISTMLEDGDCWATLTCNACPDDVDVSNLLYEETHIMMHSLVHFLEHCAFEHIGGAEPIIGRHYAPLSAYQVNLALNKPAMTDHETRWRERVIADPMSVEK